MVLISILSSGADFRSKVMSQTTNTKDNQCYHNFFQTVHQNNMNTGNNVIRATCMSNPDPKCCGEDSLCLFLVQITVLLPHPWPLGVSLQLLLFYVQ